MATVLQMQAEEEEEGEEEEEEELESTVAVFEQIRVSLPGGGWSIIFCMIYVALGEMKIVCVLGVIQNNL